MNSVFIICLFLGQTTGSTAGTHLYTGHGWVVSSGLSLGLLGLAFLVLFARGPHSSRWVGWDGGSRLSKKRTKTEAQGDIEASGEASGMNKAGSVTSEKAVTSDETEATTSAR